MVFRTPRETERTVILGSTGSGKSVFAMFLLAQASWGHMPWVIIDYKGDELIEDILLQNGWHEKKERGRKVIVRGFNSPIKELSPADPPPKKPGLYYMRPDAKVDDDLVEAFLLAVYNRGNIGLFIDEGYAIPEKNALDMIFTQGRSKRIPVIILYQRPVYMSRFAVAQASFFAVFEQNDKRDLKTTKEFIKPVELPDGREITVDHKLPEHCSIWFDVAARKAVVLTPCPHPDNVASMFKNRLSPEKGRQRECPAVTLS